MPVVLNLYILITGVYHGRFSVVDLQDTFGALSPAKNSQELIALDWEDPQTGRKKYYRWTGLP